MKKKKQTPKKSQRGRKSLPEHERRKHQRHLAYNDAEEDTIVAGMKASDGDEATDPGVFARQAVLHWAEYKVDVQTREERLLRLAESQQKEIARLHEHISELTASIEEMSEVVGSFGRTAERKTERRLLRDYEATIEHCLAALSQENYDVVVELASLPEGVRGFGPVKERHIAQYDADREALLSRLNISRLVRAA